MLRIENGIGEYMNETTTRSKNRQHPELQMGPQHSLTHYEITLTRVYLTNVANRGRSI